MIVRVHRPSVNRFICRLSLYSTRLAGSVQLTLSISLLRPNHRRLLSVSLPPLHILHQSTLNLELVRVPKLLLSRIHLLEHLFVDDILDSDKTSVLLGRIKDDGLGETGDVGVRDVDIGGDGTGVFERADVESGDDLGGRRGRSSVCWTDG